MTVVVPIMGTVTIITEIVGGFGVVQVITMDIITTAHMAIGVHPTCVVGGVSGQLMSIIIITVVVEALVVVHVVDVVAVLVAIVKMVRVLY